MKWRQNIASRLAIILSTALIFQPVQAIETTFYATNNILYPPVGSACTPSSSSASLNINTTASQDKRAEEILRYFTGKGMTLAQATGFVGNMMQESGLNPAIIQGGKIAPANYTPENGKGFGLVQWTWTSRQAPLVKLAQDSERDIRDMGLQLDNVWRELQGEYKSTLQALQARQSEMALQNKDLTPTDAAIIIHGNTWKDSRYNFAPKLGYEASADSIQTVLDRRGGTAEAMYKKFRDTIQDGQGITSDSLTTSNTTVSSTGCSPAPPSDCQPHEAIGDKGPEQHARLFGTFQDPSNWVPIGTFMDFTSKQTSNPFDGHMVNKAAIPCLRAVEAELKASPTAGTYKVWSFICSRKDNMPTFYHGYAAACDINATNTGGKGNGCGFCAGFGNNNHDIPDEWVRIFEKYGWTWGGRWYGGTNGDWMHFQYEGPESERGK